MRLHGLTARLALFALGALSALAPISSGCEQGLNRVEPASAQAVGALQWVIQEKLLTSDTNSYNYLGWSVSISGDTAAVGAYRADGDRGATYVFLRSGDTWTEQARLTPADGQPGDLFGGSVAIEGDTVVIGAPLDSGAVIQYTGSVYVFTRSAGVWTEQAKLRASDASQLDALGWAVSISGDTVVAGAYNSIQAPFAEAAYVFVGSGGEWTEQQKLTASDGGAGGLFGISVAVNGDTAIVGAAGADALGSDSGAAYVFTRSSGIWTEQAILAASDTTVGDNFGWSVSLSGETAVIGAIGEDATTSNSGAAYVFVGSGGAWAEQAKLAASDGSPGDSFGYSVSVSGDTAAVGAVSDDAPGMDSGSAYVFARDGAGWLETAHLIASDGVAGDWLGISVATSGETVVVGAVEDDSQFLDDTGSSYVFTLRSSNGEPCVEDRACASGFCADGVCCGSVCDGECSACSAATKGGGIDGECGAVADGTDPDNECAPLSCGGGACLTSCESTSQCAQGHYCDPSSKDCELLADDIGDRSACSAAPDLSAGSSPRWIVLLGAGIALVILGRRRGAPASRSSGLALVIGAAACGPAAPGDAGEPTRAAVSRLEADPVVTAEQAKLTAGDGEPGDIFGNRLAIDGDTAVVGAHLDDGQAMQSGSAHVFVRSGGAWAAQAKLTALDGADDAYFGASIALSGDTAVVGAPNSNGQGKGSGAAYVFVRSGDAWIQQAKLTASDEAAEDQFGASVVLAGETLVVGSPNSDTVANQSGSAYVFVRTSDVWFEEAKLKASDAAANDRFGVSVALSGDTAVIGATFEDDRAVDSGAAYVFVRGGGLWAEQSKLKASDAASDDLFGTSIAVAADTAVVGALYHDTRAVNAGAAYVFVRSGGAWVEEAILLASDGDVDDRFGSSVAVAADTVVVGAPSSNGPVESPLPDSGAAYVFMRIGAWAERAKLRASDGAEGDVFGASVAVVGDTVVAGAPSKDGSGPDLGAAYVHLLGAPGHCEDETHSVDTKPPGAPEGVLTDCAPRRCDQESGVCLTRCESTEDCVSGYFCHPSTGDCEPQPDRDIGDERACGAAPGRPSGASMGAIVFLIVAALRRRAGRIGPKAARKPARGGQGRR